MGCSLRFAVENGRVERKGETGPVGQSQSKGHLEVAHRCRFLRATFKGQGLQHRFIGSVLNYPRGLWVVSVSNSVKFPPYTLSPNTSSLVCAGVALTCRYKAYCSSGFVVWRRVPGNSRNATFSNSSHSGHRNTCTGSVPHS